MSATARQTPDLRSPGHLRDRDRMMLDCSIFCPACHQNPISTIRQKIPFQQLRENPGCTDKTRTLYVVVPVPALPENEGVYLKEKIRHL